MPIHRPCRWSNFTLLCEAINLTDINFPATSSLRFREVAFYSILIKMLHYSGDIFLPFLQTFPDGSLYINNLGLHHMGNYTCQDKYEDTVIQTHVLRVQCKCMLYFFINLSFSLKHMTHNYQVKWSTWTLCTMCNPLISYSQSQGHEISLHHNMKKNNLFW